MRKRLLVVRAGNSSIHRQWVAAGHARSFDLFVSAYTGAPAVEFEESSEHMEYRMGLKYDALHALIASNEEFFLSYDYVGFPDDDIAASSADWNCLFDLMAIYRLDLAQASLLDNGNVGHRITAHVEGPVLRLTNFVEVMMPVFAKSVLRTAWRTFQYSGTGWGLDFVWQKLYPYPCYRTAIVDAVMMSHTRPVGKGEMYAAAAAAKRLPAERGRQLARQQGAWVARLFDLRPKPPEVIGHVPKEVQSRSAQ